MLSLHRTEPGEPSYELFEKETSAIFEALKRLQFFYPRGGRCSWDKTRIISPRLVRFGRVKKNMLGLDLQLLGENFWYSLV